MMNLIFASKNCVQEKLLKVIQSRNKKTIFVCSQWGERAFSDGKKFMKSHCAQTFPQQFFNSVTKRECSQTIVKM